ncbi:MAG: hypothetical protein AAB669_01010 [Patescibacteria group bacterium]
MSKTVRIILSIAFAIFVAGIVWAIVATRNNKKDATPETANTPTLVGTPSSTATPAVTTPATTPAPATPASKPATKKVTPRYRVVFVEETTDEVSASAWASAGTNTDGSAWAEAHAE